MAWALAALAMAARRSARRRHLPPFRARGLAGPRFAPVAGQDLPRRHGSVAGRHGGWPSRWRTRAASTHSLGPGPGRGGCARDCRARRPPSFRSGRRTAASSRSSPRASSRRWTPPADRSSRSAMRKEGSGEPGIAKATIVFAPLADLGALSRRRPQAASPSPVTKLDASRHEVAHRYPYFLPDGRHVLYTTTNLGARANESSNAIRVASLDGRDDQAASSACFRAPSTRPDVFSTSRDDDSGRAALRSGAPRSEGRAGRDRAARQPNDRLGEASTRFPRRGTRWFWRVATPGPDRGSPGSIDPASLPDPSGTPTLYVTYRFSPDGRTLAASVFNASKNKLDIWT